VTKAEAELARDGYRVLPDLLSAIEVEWLRREVDRLMATSPGTTCARPNNTLVGLRWDDAIVAGIVADDERLERLRRAARANDLRWISGYISVKEARSLPLEWHRDWWCWDHPVSLRPEPVQIALLCYLSETDDKHGALRVQPGSHAASGKAREVTLRLRTGDAVVLDYRIEHGTHGNAGGRRRDCILLSFTPSWKELPDEIRSHLISHPALPGPDEAVPATGWSRSLLPSYAGPRRDLPLRRDPPAHFAIAGSPRAGQGGSGPGWAAGGT
jgi:hypothetical protein